jgi:hypothetical protein
MLENPTFKIEAHFSFAETMDQPQTTDLAKGFAPPSKLSKSELGAYAVGRPIRPIPKG